jgi:excisionase family DNA binding protein
VARTVQSRELLTIAEIASMFGVNAKTVTRWDKSDRFPPETVFRTPGGHRRFYRDKVEAWMHDLGYRHTRVADD